jgi:4-hydroxythreonine-4-phosphate dehydrogenase
MSKNCKPILVVAGEPYSVFLEIFFKSFRNNKFKKPIILIVSYNLLMKQMKSFNYKLKTNLIDPKKINYNDINSKHINIIDVNFKFIKSFDKISNKSNHYINKCFKIALDLLKTKKFSGMINGPISKKNFLGSKYLGITEFLANKTLVKKNVVMLIYNKKLSVSPLTTHLPIKRVHKNINKKKLIDQVKLISEFYQKKLNTIPKIAVTGLNPHCESNYTSSEEDRVIKPAIKYLKNNRFRVFGPFAADTIFLKENLKNYDVIIGMYHDQVLTPIKTLFGFDAINITLGLPFVRISPDHGPNTSMVGKNLSNPKSLVEALKFLDN